MPDKIFIQPDGKLAVFSTVTGTFVVADATDADLMDRAARMAAEAARLRVAREIGQLCAGTADRSMTWEAALESDREHGGDLFKTCPSCQHGMDIHADDGCWFTVTAGRPEKNAVCQCRIRRNGTDPLEVKE